VSGAAPTLASLTDAFDVLLVYADLNFPTAPAVGNVAADFANTGRTVVLGTFYDQQRSDAGGSGWGARLRRSIPAPPTASRYRRRTGRRAASTPRRRSRTR
jgi:hypothetical protein